MLKKEFYSTAIYARLSREDGNGVESNSIANQISFIKEYIKSAPELHIVSIRKDDGYSGVDFLRPDFKEMMEDIKRGKVDCVIVKDFSRFGRNHLEVAEYLEHVFPFMGVRFISINDNYDSIHPASDSDHIVIPFKNLINESYLRDISIKVRTSLNSKREKGEFVGNFAPYGYIRNPEDKHKLVIDPYAANIVRRIFRMKISGMSHSKIADSLNTEGEPSPIEYKNMNGIHQYTPLKRNIVTKWSYITIDRILKNDVYIGTLSQGKQTTPSYKVKKVIIKPQAEWAVIENAHFQIISKSDFEIVQRILKIDTRTAPGNNEVALFSGMLYCADCKNSMVRKSVSSKGKKYYYYVCATNKYQKACSSHSISEEKLKEAVKTSLQTQIKLVLNMSEALKRLKNLPENEKELPYSKEQLKIREKELEEVQQLRRGLYEDYRSDIITKDDFIVFNSQYAQKVDALKNGIEQLLKEIEILLDEQKENPDWIERYCLYDKETELTRSLLVSLVEKIGIHEKNKIHITYFFQDKLQFLEKFLHDQDRMEV